MPPMASAKAVRVPKSSSQEDELMKAILANDEASVAALLGLGVKPNYMSSDTGITPAVAAAENGFATILKHLLKSGAEVNTELSNGNYPLRAAILSGDGDCCRLLIEHGADVNHCRCALGGVGRGGSAGTGNTPPQESCVRTNPSHVC